MSLFASAYWPVSLHHGPVTLRPLRWRDQRAWEEIRTRNADWLRPWDSTRPPESTESSVTFAQMVSTFNARARGGRMLPWAVDFQPEPDAGPVLAGQLTISGITFGSACWAMAGYWVDQQWAGRSITPTALAMATDHCFTALHLHRMEVAIRSENVNSLRVVQKLGFRHEGRRERYMHVDGQWRDHEMFALHSDEVPGGLLSRLPSHG